MRIVLETRADIRQELALAAEAREEFAREMRGSMRAHASASEDFRTDMRERVGKIEITLAEGRGAEQQTARWGTIAAWAVGTLIAVAAILVPLLWSKL